MRTRRFELHADAARKALHECIRSEGADDLSMQNSLYLTDDWDPREDLDHGTVTTLIETADAVGWIVGPANVAPIIECDSDGSPDVYRFAALLPTGAAIVTPVEELLHIGAPDTVGLSAAMSILTECVHALNQALDEVRGALAA